MASVCEMLGVGGGRRKKDGRSLVFHLLPYLLSSFVFLFLCLLYVCACAVCVCVRVCRWMCRVGGGAT